MVGYVLYCFFTLQLPSLLQKYRVESSVFAKTKAHETWNHKWCTFDVKTAWEPSLLAFGVHYLWKKCYWDIKYTFDLFQVSFSQKENYVFLHDNGSVIQIESFIIHLLSLKREHSCKTEFSYLERIMIMIIFSCIFSGMWSWDAMQSVFP